MNQQFAIAALISDGRRELGISNGALVRRLGYSNAGKGARRLEALRQGDLSNKFILDALPAALGLAADEVNRAIRATSDQLAEKERLRMEAEEQRYRERFKPHGIWATEFERPTSITMVALRDKAVTCAPDKAAIALYRSTPGDQSLPQFQCGLPDLIEFMVAAASNPTLGRN